MTRKRYLDYAATTPTHPEVAKAMYPYFTEMYGNPSSLHSYGQEARDTVEKARAQVASFLGAQPGEIIFTSGGTEADNTALIGIAYANESRGNHIIISTIEHHAVIETSHFLEKRGFKITALSVDSYGMVAPDDVRKAITSKTILISVMHASNEVGTIQPIAQIGKIAHEADVCFHTDAVQTFGHIPLDVGKQKVDLLSISAHKLYGPKGVGALYVRKGCKIVPFIHGGGQEDGRRGSTHNVPGIVGFAKALEIAGEEMDEEAQRVTAFRDRLIRGLLDSVSYIRLNGHPAKRLPNNVNVSIDFVEGEAMLLNLDFEGICASTGSACSSLSMEASHVLMAMGIPTERARCSLRFSLGKWTTEDDIDTVLEVLPRIVTKLRAISPLATTETA